MDSLKDFSRSYLRPAVIVAVGGLAMFVAVIALISGVHQLVMIAITNRVWILRYGSDFPNHVAGVRASLLTLAEAREVSRDPTEVGAIFSGDFSSVLVIRSFVGSRIWLID